MYSDIPSPSRIDLCHMIYSQLDMRLPTRQRKKGIHPKRAGVLVVKKGIDMAKLMMNDDDSKTFLNQAHI